MLIADIKSKPGDSMILVTGPWGEYEELLGGACVTPMGATSVKFGVQDLNFVFEFNQDPDRSGQHIEQISAIEKTLRVALINFNDPIGVQTQSPVGQINGRELVFSFYVSFIGQVDKPETHSRAINYSFLLKVS